MKIFLIVIICILIMFSLFNAKVNVLSIIKDHYKTFYNARTNKVSIIDIITFTVTPLIVAVVLVCCFKLSLISHINSLITVYSIFAGLLLNFLVLIVGVKKKDSENYNKLIIETITNTSFAILLTLFNVVLLCIMEYITLQVIIQILTVVIIFLSLVFVFTVLMILKRIYKLQDSK